MSKKNPLVDAFIDRADAWQDEYKKLRSIALASGLTEELKWGKPCYTLDGDNIILIHGFKDYCAMLFNKGALLKDSHKLLVQQTKNVQAARQLRFRDLQTVNAQKDIIKDYIQEAIDIEKAGLRIDFKKTEQFEMVEEFRAQLEKSSKLKQAFEALTPGRQRGYLLHFSSAKQAKTREARVAKCMPQILAGKGIND